MNKIIIGIVALLFVSCTSFGQWYDPEKVNTKATDIYLQAVTKAQKGDYNVAIKEINDAIALEPRYVDAFLSLGGIYADKKKYAESVTNFEKAFLLDSIYSKNYLLPYSISLSGKGEFKKALVAVNTFLTDTTLNERSVQAGNFRKETYLFAIDYQKTHEVEKYVFNPVNLGDSVNTADLEYFPTLTIDGKKLIFTRRIKNKESFYESELNGGSWSKAKPLIGKINASDYNNGASNISQDGQWLIFTGCNFPEGLGSCDLYISYLTKQGWSEPENMGPNINSHYWESSPSLSPDKKDLYFSSSVPGGHGGMDIWVSHRDDNGKWGPAKNLGPEINTAGNETCPFIHADNQTLYFSSTGQPGYSEKPDLFVSRKLADGSWGRPENLGYPINTIDDESSLIVAADGKTAYFTSDRYDTKGGLDIYTFELREDIRPLQTLWIRGKVYDIKTGKGLPSSVQLTDVVTRQVISKIQTDEEGNYLTTLPVGKMYAFNVSRKGYLFYSDNFDLSKKIPDSTYNKDIPMKSIEANASIILRNVFFDTKKTDLKPESISELDNVVRLMNENPGIKIQISGYTDNVGKPADNLILSKGRAVSVVNYLIRKGVKSDRLTFKGYGEGHPIGDNKTEQGRSLNRRTELSIVSVK